MMTTMRTFVTAAGLAQLRDYDYHVDGLVSLLCLCEFRGAPEWSGLVVLSDHDED
jgi:hypothetical protein